MNQAITSKKAFKYHTAIGNFDNFDRLVHSALRVYKDCTYPELAHKLKQDKEKVQKSLTRLKKAGKAKFGRVKFIAMGKDKHTWVYIPEELAKEHENDKVYILVSELDQLRTDNSKHLDMLTVACNKVKELEAKLDILESISRAQGNVEEVMADYQGAIG